MAARVGKNPDLVQQVRASFQFKLTGDTGGAWFVNLKEGAGAVGAGVMPDADCTIIMSPQAITATCISVQAGRNAVVCWVSHARLSMAKAANAPALA